MCPCDNCLTFELQFQDRQIGKAWGPARIHHLDEMKYCCFQLFLPNTSFVKWEPIMQGK